MGLNESDGARRRAPGATQPAGSFEAAVVAGGGGRAGVASKVLHDREVDLSEYIDTITIRNEAMC